MASRAREVRLFFTQDFDISGNSVGDTAAFDPVRNAIVHYKGSRYFLVNGSPAGGKGFSQFAVGQKGIGGKEGTFKDAEDGVLSGNPIAQGSVDSTLGVALTLAPGASGELHYWMAAGRDFQEVKTIDAVVRDKTPAELLGRKKAGFVLPLADWFRGPLRQRLHDTVLGPALAETGLFDMRFAAALAAQHQSGAFDRSAALWTLSMFDAFLRDARQPPREGRLPAPCKMEVGQ
jgi:hypothetical protein